MGVVVGLKERIVRVQDQCWEWVMELPDPILTAVFCLTVGTVVCLWTLALLYFIWPLVWHALQWGEGVSFQDT